MAAASPTGPSQSRPPELPAEPIQVAALATSPSNKTVIPDASSLEARRPGARRIDAGNIGQGKAPDLRSRKPSHPGDLRIRRDNGASGYTTGLPHERSGHREAGTFDAAFQQGHGRRTYSAGEYASSS